MGMGSYMRRLVGISARDAEHEEFVHQHECRAMTVQHAGSARRDRAHFFSRLRAGPPAPRLIAS